MINFSLDFVSVIFKKKNQFQFFFFLLFLIRPPGHINVKAEDCRTNTYPSENPEKELKIQRANSPSVCLFLN